MNNIGPHAFLESGAMAREGDTCLIPPRHLLARLYHKTEYVLEI